MKIFSIIGILSFLYISKAIEIEPNQEVVIQEPSGVVPVPEVNEGDAAAVEDTSDNTQKQRVKRRNNRTRKTQRK